MTLGSILFAGTSGLISQDNANFTYGPTGYSGGPNCEIGPAGSNPDDAVLEAYAATAGLYTAHFHNNGVHGATGGPIVSLNATSTGTPAAMASGDRLGSLQFAGTYDNTLAIQSGAAINGFATQAWTSVHAGSKLVFNTVPNNSLTRTLALTIDQDQSATFTGALNAGATIVSSLTDSGLTATRIPFAGTSGILQDSAYLRSLSIAVLAIGSGTVANIAPFEAAAFGRSIDAALATLYPVAIYAGRTLFCQAKQTMYIDIVGGVGLISGYDYGASVPLNIWMQGDGGNIGVGYASSPTARLHLGYSAGAAGTASLKIDGYALLATPEAGAIESNGDNLHFTIATGAARKHFVLDDGSQLTSGKIPVASTNGRLIDGQTPLSGTKVYYVSDTLGGLNTRKLTFTNGILTAET
jgi:hypothetical protein